LDQVSEENASLRLNDKTASIGFIYRHIGETMNLFGQFFGIPTDVIKTNDKGLVGIWVRAAIVSASNPVGARLGVRGQVADPRVSSWKSIAVLVLLEFQFSANAVNQDLIQVWRGAATEYDGACARFPVRLVVLRRDSYDNRTNS
jgi:hypothetical protein